VRLPESVIERQSNIRVRKRIDYKIDPAAVRVLMSLLSKLYSNPELAVLRELSTNARDAMIEAGRGHLPIEVTTPRGYNQILTIKDTGIGMDIFDLEDIYTSYATSTKRSNDDLNGALGVGSKSPFAITDQYTVVAVKNGIKTSAIISRSPEGGGSMDIISELETTEPNGVEIQIATRRGSDFETLAKNLFMYWAPNTVLLNSVEPAKFKGDKVTDKIYLDLEYNYYGKDVIVMSGVPYPLPERMSQFYQVVYFADNGEIDFTPSRESLELTERTRGVITNLKAEVNRLIAKQFQDKVDAFDNIRDAVMLFANNGSLLNTLSVPLAYKGYAWPQRYSLGYYHNNMIRYSGDTATKVDSIGIDDANRNKFNVVISDVKRLSPTMKEKLDFYAGEHNLDNQWIIADNYLNSYWLSELNYVDWEDIKVVKLPFTSTAKGVKRGPIAEYKLWDGDWTDNKIDPTKPVYYVGASDYQWDEVKFIINATGAEQVAKVYKVKMKPFMEAFPQAAPLDDLIVSTLNDFYRKINIQDAVDYVHYVSEHNYEWNALRRVLPSIRDRMLDTHIVSEYDRLNGVAALVDRKETMRVLRGKLKDWSQVSGPKGTYKASIGSLMGDYPMFLPAMVTRWHTPNDNIVLDYLNATYTFNKEKK
jgi:hypothetical protein